MARIKQVARKTRGQKRLFAGGTPSTSNPQARERSRHTTASPDRSENQTRKKRRNRPGTKALREIRKYQKSWNLLIPVAPFIRAVREISTFYAPNITRWQAEALVAIQEAAEDYIVEMFDEANLCAIHAKRVTLSELEVKGGHGGESSVPGYQYQDGSSAKSFDQIILMASMDSGGCQSFDSDNAIGCRHSKVIK
ncbi:histone H3 [Striga asiatica]|uniref:Histone H3 n=1 Tax=Striga asiatica TaxID=4170 RepID=A0A5A7PTM3_STRAF|nr:histone H3 [Striga asiatica]